MGSNAMKVRTASRARDIGIPFDGSTGPANAITDVDGVQIGHRQQSDNVRINTGVTAILPFNNNHRPGNGNGIDVFTLGAWSAVNGCGEMTGTTWLEESGLLEGPILLTNTANVGRVRDAVINYSKLQQPQPIDLDNFDPLLLPVVGETYDGWLKDILGFQIPETMVADAINDGKTYTDIHQVEEGNFGGGTGMTSYDWKGGIGTSSRQAVVTGPGSGSRASRWSKTYTVGVLVQANQGKYWELVVRGVPAGRDPQFQKPPMAPSETISFARRTRRRARKSSIIVVIATDAPLLPHQLKRVARRATHGIARSGTSTNGDSGEIFIAFSTANTDAADDQVHSVDMVPNGSMDPLFDATVDATEEAILNALVAATTLTGAGGKHTATAIMDPPLGGSLSLVDIMKKYNRWVQPTH
jgi:L-aminopeptidase/D-esterase-like protein